MSTVTMGLSTMGFVKAKCPVTMGFINDKVFADWVFMGRRCRIRLNFMCFKERQLHQLQEGIQRQLRLLKIAKSTYKLAVPLTIYPCGILVENYT